MSKLGNIQHIQEYYFDQEDIEFHRRNSYIKKILEIEERLGINSYTTYDIEKMTNTQLKGLLGSLKRILEREKDILNNEKSNHR